MKRMVRWCIGLLIGTLLVAITSPVFVRSYLPLHADTLRAAWTLPPGSTYRWRSEGYASTSIGPHGMPGKTALRTTAQRGLRIALWGDSQAEGVCVADTQKLFAQIERRWNLVQSATDPVTVDVLPLARSGEDAADWATQMLAIDSQLGIDAHVLLIVDLPDLLTASAAPLPPPDPADISRANNAIAARLPAFVIQAARHLLTETDGVTPRRLRFAVGPVAPHSPADINAAGSQVEVTGSQVEVAWQPILQSLKEAAGQTPIIIVYAPVIPQIVADRVLREDPFADDFEAMRTAAFREGIEVVDLRPKFRDAAAAGDWSHGFHNGRIGSGHLNTSGYDLIARELLPVLNATLSVSATSN